jgi:hypothetical protein
MTVYHQTQRQHTMAIVGTIRRLSARLVMLQTADSYQQMPALRNISPSLADLLPQGTILKSSEFEARGVAQAQLGTVDSRWAPCSDSM